MPIYKKIPGIKINRSQIDEVFVNFVKKFREEGIPLNIPTSCCLKGEKDKEIFRSDFFLSKDNVYLFFDYDKDLRLLTAHQVLDFYENLEPWEDYDFCIFDETLKWCIGVTHNDDVIVVKNDSD